MATQTEPQTTSDLATIANDLAALKRDLAALVSNLAAGSYNSTAAAAQGAAEQISGQASELYEQAATQAARGAKTVMHEIEERPLTTLLMAFSIGFIASRLLAR